MNGSSRSLRRIRCAAAEWPVSVVELTVEVGSDRQRPQTPVIGLGPKADAGGLGRWAGQGWSELFAAQDEAKPLVVTCAGIDIGAAKARLRAMHGSKRVPTPMKLALRLAKNTD